MPQFTQAFVQVLALADSPTVDCGLKMEVLKVSSFTLNSSNLFLNVMLPLSSSTLIINISNSIVQFQKIFVLPPAPTEGIGISWGMGFLQDQII